jgi:hypothetical protein
MIMKKRVKVLASAFLMLGILSLSTETSKASTICYSTIYEGNEMWSIWRCTPGPEGCVRERAEVYLDDLWCSAIGS